MLVRQVHSLTCFISPASGLIKQVNEQLLFALQDDSRISAKCRDAKVEDLWSLTSFFGYSTHTFVLAVNLLDRFLAMMRVRDIHVVEADRAHMMNNAANSTTCCLVLTLHVVHLRSSPSTCPALASAASTWRLK